MQNDIDAVRKQLIMLKKHFRLMQQSMDEVSEMIYKLEEQMMDQEDAILDKITQSAWRMVG